MSYIDFSQKRIVVFGLANKKSIAFFVARQLLELNAEVILVVRSAERQETAKKLFPQCRSFICDVEEEENIIALAGNMAEAVDLTSGIHGIVHSLAFANYSEGFKPFHQTRQKDFLQAVNISCFSLISISNHFKEYLHPDASVVTVSISTTKMAAENYGYMGPVKAALDSSLCFLAKSFSSFSRVRFNAVAPGLLKTSASAGIPGYIDSYLYAEKAILRKKAITTREAADGIIYLLSERSSGITAQTLVVDGGMAVNYFDREIVEKTVG
ncbi:MAG: enoyl-ACP reductase [Desulfobacterales bacterium]|nr:MAG: enoyl-ACP reductase [Desulfobacterales bacterium]